ncbi:MAG: ACDE family multidrug resistance protein [Planctomycetota bacterium]|jgi:ACDE family multidrug resistance protein
MYGNRNPAVVDNIPVPGVKAFAWLSALESSARSILISVLPIAMYRVFTDAKLVSEIYFIIGVLSFIAALVVPLASRFLPRRWLYTFSVLSYIAGAVIGIFADSWMLAVGLGLMTVSVVVMTVCFNAYVMDYINRARLGECETLRLFYSGAAWTLGPFLGIWLMGIWKPAPFILAGLAAACLLFTFWRLRLGNGKAIQKAKTKPPNPFAYLGKFIRQPRLVAGWTFAVIRSCGWWVYVVYLPIYAVENGYSEQLGGILLSLSNAFLFLTPLMLKVMRGFVKKALLLGFVGSGSFFLLASLNFVSPGVAIGLLVVGSFFLILLDMSAGLPFLMAVKPAQRTEMSAVYATYRDVSGILTPGTASLLLIVAPLQMMFSLAAVGLLGCAYVATKLHPRLGRKRVIPIMASPIGEDA